MNISNRQDIASMLSRDMEAYKNSGRGWIPNGTIIRFVYRNNVDVAAVKIENNFHLAIERDTIIMQKVMNYGMFMELLSFPSVSNVEVATEFEEF